MHSRLEWAYKKAQEISQKEIKHHKRHDDLNIHCSKLAPRDLVLVRQKASKGKHKIWDQWENTPYHAQQEGETIKSQVLHKNMLFPVIMKHDSDSIQQSSMDHEIDDLNLDLDGPNADIDLSR